MKNVKFQSVPEGMLHLVTGGFITPDGGGADLFITPDGGGADFFITPDGGGADHH